MIILNALHTVNVKTFLVRKENSHSLLLTEIPSYPTCQLLYLLALRASVRKNLIIILYEEYPRSPFSIL